MKFYNLEGIPVQMQEFSGDSVIVIRVTKRMEEEDFKNFIEKNSEMVSETFADINSQVLFCPDWIEFKEWK